ncbi:hypothetical protein TRFO_28026 [Tritrichomonas foetus]|uniref:Alpha-1,2-Mannosidase n=1 Tax=Tritrichomonas foetus TaxID=1144522 RepID=A0A1J4K149_9EUKA|nr:hypothetical protein TRFO_28026 [Tritrichomonas foetus]|eukprot:OHT04512.1 hypothetical protein TRFO_28026 [Tritrichomonas foetus]
MRDLDSNEEKGLKMITYIIYLGVLPLIFAIISGVIFYLWPIETSQAVLVSLPTTGKHKYNISISKENLEFSEIFKNSASLAFTQYYKYCLNYGEYRPQSKECISNPGFPVSIFESLETLFLLNDKENYEKAKYQILNNFSLFNLDYVDIHEFWGRGIGSLLGIFQLSGEMEFLKLAAKCAEEILSFGKADFINFRSKQTKNYVDGKKILSNWFMGIPELISINHYIKKPLFQKYIESQKKLNPIDFLMPRIRENRYRNYFLTSFVKNGYLTDFLPEIIESDTAFDNSQFYPFFDSNSEKYQYPSDFLERLEQRDPKYWSIRTNRKKINYQNLMGMIFYGFEYNNTRMPKTKLTLASQFLRLQKTFPKKLLNCLESETRFGSQEDIIGFTFKGDEILDLAIRGEKEKVLNSIRNSIKKYYTPEGFHGMRISSIGKFYDDDIQHTEFLGEWLKVGALLTSAEELLKRAVFNEFGHIIYIK